MLAEAEKRSKQTTHRLGLYSLNLVRKRAGIPEVKNLSYDQFQQEVRDERARELCLSLSASSIWCAGAYTLTECRTY